MSATVRRGVADASETGLTMRLGLPVHISTTLALHLFDLILSHLNLSMLAASLLTLALIAQPASCSRFSPEADPIRSNISTCNTSAANNLGGEELASLQADELSKRNNDAALRQNARKRGVAWQLRGSGSLAPFATLGTYYTYGPYGYATPEDGPAFVPQLWGCSDAHVDEFRARMSSEWAIVGGDGECVFFSQPRPARITKRGDTRAARRDARAMPSV